MFFEDDTIYSYGYHFPIATKMKDGKLLFNDERYSSSTARHQDYVLSACSHYDIIHCATIDGTPGSKWFLNENLGKWREDIDWLVKKMALAVKPEIWLTKILGVVKTVERFCAYFNIGVPEDFYKFKDEEKVEEVRKFAKEERKKELEEERRREAKSMVDFLSFKTNWYNSNYQIVRYREEKNRFETSKHVEIPFEIGKRFYEALRDGELRVGDHVLYYRVDSVGEVVRIGCHSFKKKWLLEYGKKIFGE